MKKKEYLMTYGIQASNDCKDIILKNLKTMQGYSDIFLLM